MRNYNFEYNNQKYATKLGGLLFLLFFVLVFTLIFITRTLSIEKNLSFVLTIIIAGGIPIFLFKNNRKKIKKEGIAIIDNTSITFKLHDVEEKINFEDINSYLIQIYNGTLLNIKFKNGKTFKLFASPNFCDVSLLDAFCQDLETIIEEYKTINNLKLEKKKSFFENAWLFPFLVIITSLFVFFIIYALWKGRSFPVSSFLMSLGPLITLWVGYLTTRKKNLNQ